MLPASFLGTGTERKSIENVDFSLSMNRGFSGGMIIRRGFTELLSLEFGLNYVKRNYTYAVTDSAYSTEDRFRIIGYELPVSLMAFVRLGEQIYMNGSLGAGVDAFASSIITDNGNTGQRAIKRHTAYPSLNANIGWEFRTYDAGTIYLGATYHRPLGDIYDNSILYRNNGTDYLYNTVLSGSYLTADLRFYFNGQRDKPTKR